MVNISRVRKRWMGVVYMRIGSYKVKPKHERLKVRIVFRGNNSCMRWFRANDCVRGDGKIIFLKYLMKRYHQDDRNDNKNQYRGHNAALIVVIWFATNPPKLEVWKEVERIE